MILEHNKFSHTLHNYIEVIRRGSGNVPPHDQKMCAIELLYLVKNTDLPDF